MIMARSTLKTRLRWSLRASWHGFILQCPPGAPVDSDMTPCSMAAGASQCTSAELAREEKNRISHRGLASRQLIVMLETLHGS